MWEMTPVGTWALSTAQRLCLGIVVLMIVDIIWVSSSELTEFIFHDSGYQKPFFTTYLKTSMFMLYLMGFCIWKPWREQCKQQRQGYLVPENNCEDDAAAAETTSLSDPVYVPIHQSSSAPSSGTESDVDGAAGGKRKGKRSVRFNKLTEVRHLSEMEAHAAMLSRLSYPASVRASQSVMRQANKLSPKQVAGLAIMFCLLWFLGNYSYQAALVYSEAALVNILSSSSSLFTLLFASTFPSGPQDRFTVSKLTAVFLNIVGVVVVCLSDMKDSTVSHGAIWATLSAVFYAAYIVMIRRQVDHEDRLDIPMFFGFVGLWNFLLLWPGFFILHYSHYELFSWPTAKQWALLIVNGLIGTVLSEFLWLWGCFLSSSLIATLSLSLTIPLSLLADGLLKKLELPLLLYLGTIPVLIAFFAVAFLQHFENWDPIMEGLHRAWFFIWKKRKSSRLLEADIEQSESLIGINSTDDQDQEA